MNYKVVINESEEGFPVRVCLVAGLRVRLKRRRLQDAIREYLEAIADLARGEGVREVNVTV